MKTLPYISLIALLAAATPAMAQSPGSAKASTETAQSFVNKAAQDGMTEVTLGKLAASKAQSPDVKKFGDRMVQDHGKANTELQALARSKGLQVPSRLDAKHQSIVDMLSGKSGADFDASYAQHMSADHSEAIKLFEDASRMSDGDVAGFAKKTLPTLREHKRMADSLNGGAHAGASTPAKVP
jgi:putative membrane protein